MRRSGLPRKALCLFVAAAFFATNLFYATPGFAKGSRDMAVFNLPVPGTMVHPSKAFVPVLLKGMTVHPEDPLKFDFIVDSGNTKFSQDEIRKETERLVKYFLASMTVPTGDFWVNLSPEEKDRVIPEELSKTELGRDLLAQDYLLKQLTASLMYPEKELGEEFWKNVRAKAREKFGTTEIPLNSFNKVWILPENATVYEHEHTVYVVESKLKVLTDHDYLTRSQDKSQGHQVTKSQEINSQIIKELIIPEIEREVNEGKHFAPLRQIYHSLILAKWYKEAIKNSLLSKVYVDQNKVKGVDDVDPQVKDDIYAQYVRAYKKGVFNYIRKDYDELTSKPIPRKYFSGGITDKAMLIDKTDNAVMVRNAVVGKNFEVNLALKMEGVGADKAMLGDAENFQEIDFTKIKTVNLNDYTHHQFHEYSLKDAQFYKNKNKSKLLIVFNASVFSHYMSRGKEMYADGEEFLIPAVAVAALSRVWNYVIEKLPHYYDGPIKLNAAEVVRVKGIGFGIECPFVEGNYSLEEVIFDLEPNWHHVGVSEAPYSQERFEEAQKLAEEANGFISVVNRIVGGPYFFVPTVEHWDSSQGHYTYFIGHSSQSPGKIRTNVFPLDIFALYRMRHLFNRKFKTDQIGRMRKQNQFLYSRADLRKQMNEIFKRKKVLDKIKTRYEGDDVTLHYEEQDLHMPERLVYTGNKQAIENHKALGFTGTTTAHKVAADVTELLASGISDDWTITAAFVSGIDMAAHRGALKSGKKTIGAVVDIPIAPDSSEMHEYEQESANILTSGGVFVSEYYDKQDSNPAKKDKRFMPRDRIVSGLSDVVIVSEGDKNSGTVDTALKAILQGKKVYLINWENIRVLADDLNLNINEIKQGAREQILEIAQLLDEKDQWRVEEFPEIEEFPKIPVSGDDWRNQLVELFQAKLESDYRKMMSDSSENAEAGSLPQKAPISELDGVADIEDGLRKLDRHEKEMKIFRPAIGKIVVGTIQKYFEGDKRIFALGRRQGALMNLISEEMKELLARTDSLGVNSFKDELTPVDLLNSLASRGEVYSLIGYNFLENLADIGAYCQEMYRSLRPGGAMVSITDVTPYHGLIMTHSPEELLLPASAIIPGMKIAMPLGGYLVANKSKFIEEFQEFILKHPEFSNDPRAISLYQYYTSPVSTYDALLQGDPKTGKSVVKSYKETMTLMGTSFEEYNQLEYLQKRLEELVYSGGFEKVQSEIVTDSVLVDRKSIEGFPEKENVINYYAGLPWLGYDPSIPDGEVKIEATVLVVVATKSKAPSSSSMVSDEIDGADLNEITVNRQSAEGDKAMLGEVWQWIAQHPYWTVTILSASMGVGVGFWAFFSSLGQKDRFHAEKAFGIGVILSSIPIAGTFMMGIYPMAAFAIGIILGDILNIPLPTVDPTPVPPGWRSPEVLAYSHTDLDIAWILFVAYAVPIVGGVSLTITGVLLNVVGGVLRFLTRIFFRRDYGKQKGENKVKQTSEVDIRQNAWTQAENIREVRDDRWRLLAPNGEPSHLPAKLWKLVRTDTFKQWFGDWESNPEEASKIVDENGEPLVIRHTSADDFTVFREDKIASRDHKMHGGKPRLQGGLGSGMYFAVRPEVIGSFSDGEKSVIYEVFLNLRNPKVLDQSDFLTHPTWGPLRTEFLELREYLGKVSDPERTMLEQRMEDINRILKQAADKETAKALKGGFDGSLNRPEYREVNGQRVIRPSSKTYAVVVFKPESGVIKSIDNAGTFDASNSDIIESNNIRAGDKEASDLPLDEADKAALAQDPGGIDMNEIDLERQGAGAYIQFDPAQLEGFEDMQIDGFMPVIINISPLNSVLPLLGLDLPKDPLAREEDLAFSIKDSVVSHNFRHCLVYDINAPFPLSQVKV